jgi:hypothetical protein
MIQVNIFIISCTDRNLGKSHKQTPPSYLSLCPYSKVATMHEYYNMRPLSRLEYEQKFCVIRVSYFL